MKWRVIIRMSFTNDRGLQYRVARSLKSCGIYHSRTTGTWEGRAVEAEEAVKQFHNIFDLLAGLTRERGLGQLNYLWVYIDRAANKGVAQPLVFNHAS